MVSIDEIDNSTEYLSLSDEGAKRALAQVREDFGRDEFVIAKVISAGDIDEGIFVARMNYLQFADDLLLR